MSHDIMSTDLNITLNTLQLDAQSTNTNKQENKGAHNDPKSKQIKYRTEKFSLHNLTFPMNQHSTLYSTIYNELYNSTIDNEDYKYHLLFSCDVIIKSPVSVTSNNNLSPTSSSNQSLHSLQSLGEVFSQSTTSISSIRTRMIDDDNYTRAYVDDQTEKLTPTSSPKEFQPLEIEPPTIFTATPIVQREDHVLSQSQKIGLGDNSSLTFNTIPSLDQNDLNNDETDNDTNKTTKTLLPYTQTHLPNTIAPNDIDMIYLEHFTRHHHGEVIRSPISTTSNTTQPTTTTHPSSNTQIITSPSCSYKVPSIPTQIDLIQFDLVSAVESINTALQYTNPLVLPQIPSPNTTHQSTSQPHYAILESHLDQTLRMLRNTIGSLAMNAPYLYYSSQVPFQLPQVEIITKDLTGSIIMTPNKSSCMVQKEHILITQSLNSSQCIYPKHTPLDDFMLDGDDVANNNDHESTYDDNNNNNHPRPVVEYDQLNFHVERNYWGMVIIVYENDKVILDMTKNNATINQLTQSHNHCSLGCKPQYIPQVYNKITQQVDVTGIYLLCIMPYRQIPPHYHVILDEAELNLSSSVSRQTQYQQQQSSQNHHDNNPENNTLSIPTCNNSLSWNRSTWGMVNHWRSVIDGQEDAIVQDSNPSTQSLNPTTPKKVLYHTHTYNNYAPNWSYVYCMSTPTFVPGDEIIIGTQLHKDMIAKGLPDSLFLKTALKKDQTLPLHPLKSTQPWLNDGIWAGTGVEYEDIIINAVNNTITATPAATTTTSEPTKKLEPKFIFPGCFKECSQSIELIEVDSNNADIIFDQYPAKSIRIMNEMNESNNNISITTLPPTNTTTGPQFECATAILALTVVVGEDRNSIEYKYVVDKLKGKLDKSTNNENNSSTNNNNNNNNNNKNPPITHSPLTLSKFQPSLLFTTHTRRGYELPGGKVDEDDYYSTSKCPQDQLLKSHVPLTIGQVERNAVIREVLEETGLVLDRKSINIDSQLKQDQDDDNAAVILPFARFTINEQRSSLLLLQMATTLTNTISPSDTSSIGATPSISNLPTTSQQPTSHSTHSTQSQTLSPFQITRDVFIVVISYKDLIWDESIVSECSSSFLRPLFDLIPSTHFLNTRALTPSSRSLIRPNHRLVESVNANGEYCVVKINDGNHSNKGSIDQNNNNNNNPDLVIKLSPLLQEQVFPLCLRRLQAIIK